MHRSASWMVALFLALSIGCAHGHLAGPEQGGLPWIRLSGPHITLTTDLERHEAERELSKMEDLLDAMEETAWGVHDAPIPRLRFVVLRSLRRLRAFADDTTHSNRRVLVNIESYVLDEPGRGSSRVTHGEQALDQLDSTVLIIAVASNAAAPPSMPRWLRDGMPSFLSMGNVDDDDFAIGALNGDFLSSRQQRVARMRAPEAHHSTEEVATAATVIYWLRAHQPAGFTEFLRRLRDGESEPDAFAASFPGITNEQLNAEIDRRNWKQPKTPILTTRLPTFKGELAFESLLPAEVHALFAALYLGASPNRSPVAAEQELALAESLDPDNVTAALLRLRDSAESSIDRLRELSAQHPDDARPCRVMLGAATKLMKNEELLACADRVIAADPGDFAGHMIRMGALFNLRRLPETSAELLLLEKLTAPDPALWLNLAVLQATAHACTEALFSTAHGLALLPPNDDRRPVFDSSAAKIRNNCPAAAKP